MDRQPLELVVLDALWRAVRRRGSARGLAAGAGVVLVPPPRRVRRAAAVGPRARRRGRSALAPGYGPRPPVESGPAIRTAQYPLFAASPRGRRRPLAWPGVRCVFALP